MMWANKILEAVAAKYHDLLCEKIKSSCNRSLQKAARKFPAISTLGLPQVDEVLLGEQPPLFDGIGDVRASSSEITAECYLHWAGGMVIEVTIGAVRVATIGAQYCCARARLRVKLLAESPYIEEIGISLLEQPRAQV